jgi:hypothetical protein
MRIQALALAMLMIGPCESTVGPGGGVVEGTWGGKNAGVIATDSTAHVHIGCTVGDTKGGIIPGPDGRFDVPGLYNITAYPVYRGPDHPARFTGRVAGSFMTLTVSLTDTTVTLGPVTLKYGAPPQLGPCPICRIPKARRPMP